MKRQSGFSLIEMLIALTIGLVLLLGVGTVFLTMKQTYNLRQGMSSVQSNERIAMQFLSMAVRNAGADPTPVATPPLSVFLASGGFPIGVTLMGAGSNAGTDTLSVRFLSDPAQANQGCSATLTAGDNYTDVFSVAGGFLRCTETDNTASPAVSTSVNLIAGLTGINIQYGVDTSATGIGSVSQYMTGDQVTASANWTNVRTVSLTVLFTNPLAGQPGQTAQLSLTQIVPYMISL